MWNHRVLAHETPEGIHFEIHEVYYDKDGKPDMHSSEGRPVFGESIEQLSETLDRMKRCLDKPILCAGDKWPQEYAPMYNLTKDESKAYYDYVKKNSTVFEGEF